VRAKHRAEIWTLPNYNDNTPGGDATRAMKLRCTNCGELFEAELGICNACGLVLGAVRVERAVAELEFDIDIDVEEDDTESSWTEPAAVITDPNGQVDPEAVQELENVGRALSLTGMSDANGLVKEGVPVLDHDFDASSVRMTPFEVHMLKTVDGRSTISELVAASRLTLYEAVMAITSLYDKGAITIQRGPVAAGDLTMPDAERPSSRDSALELREQNALGRLALRRRATAGSTPSLSAEDPDVLLEKAQAALQAGKLELAREYTQLAIVQVPNSDRAKQLKKALHDERHAVTRAKIMLGHGIRAYWAEDFDGAIRLLSGALQEYEPLPIAHHRLALATIKVGGDLDLAESHCLRATELAPDNEIYRRNLQRIHKRLERADTGVLPTSAR